LPDIAIVPSALKFAWEEFAETRRHQAAEYHLLNREFTLINTEITIPLSNPIEEPLLQNLRLQLITHLRSRLNNSSIVVTGVLQETTAKKMIYTGKEKLDRLIEKNPALKDLKEKLGLDPDF
jgi:hypothetical protein